jgi:hypothetical protein
MDSLSSDWIEFELRIAVGNMRSYLFLELLDR